MIFHTENSTYEVRGFAVRRLSGRNDPTPRQGKDGEWRDFRTMTPVEVGSRVLFVWETVEDVAKSTVTGVVMRVEEEN